MAKYRYGFVSNSSSSSFVITVKPMSEEERIMHVLKGTHEQLHHKDVEKLVEYAGLGNGITSDPYYDDITPSEYSKDDIVSYIIEHSSNAGDEENYDPKYLPANILNKMESGYGCFVVDLSDEEGGIGAVLRNEVSSFCDISNGDFETEYFE